MDDLIEALTLLRQYDNPKFPTNCEHDVLYVAINPELVTDGDKETLERLGFFPAADGFGFMSYLFGSC